MKPKSEKWAPLSFFVLFIYPMSGRWLVHQANHHSSSLPLVSLQHADLYCIELHVSLCLCITLELFQENYCLSDKIIQISYAFSICSPKTEYFLDFLFLLFSESQEIISCSQRWWVYMHSTNRNSKQISPWEWKHSYKSRANCITDATNLIKTSLISCEHHKIHIKPGCTAEEMSDKGQGVLSHSYQCCHPELSSETEKLSDAKYILTVSFKTMF